jgi:hypothetical protein
MHVATRRRGSACTVFPLLLLCALASCSDLATPTAPAASQSALQKRDGAQAAVTATARLLTSGRQAPFGITLGPDGAMYVAEGGAGRVLRIDPATGAVSTFASGFPVNLGSGVQDVEFIGETAYVLVSFVTPEAFGGTGVDGLYRVDGPQSFTLIADIGAFNRANPPETDFFVATGVSVAMERYRGGFLITDGHLNRVLYVTRNGQVSVFRSFANIVPTGLDVLGSMIYMTEAGPLPHLPENGKVVTFDAQSSGVTEIASGIRLAVDVELGRGRTLFALSQGVWAGVEPGEPALPNTGALVRVSEDGTVANVFAPLSQPVSMEIVANTAYVVTFSGDIWAIDDIAGPPFGRGASRKSTQHYAGAR